MVVLLAFVLTGYWIKCLLERGDDIDAGDTGVPDP